MPVTHHRLVILGAGTAGLAAYKQARSVTDDVLLVDPGPLGTTCARTGCMPSKALLQLAHDAHAARRLQRAGVLHGRPPRVDGAVALAQVRAIRDRFVRGPVDEVRALGANHVEAAARFVAPDRLALGERLVRADAVIVATGSRPIIPDAALALGSRVLTSDTVFELDRLPARIAVVGTGAIGCELGQALARLGARVHAFARTARVGGIREPSLAALAARALAADWTLHVGPDVVVTPVRHGLEVRLGAVRVVVDAVLYAVGRRPAVEGLNLAALGVPLGAPPAMHGLPPIERDSHRVPGTAVYFAGDVDGIDPLLHEAADDGRRAAWHALHPDAACLKRRTPLRIVFTDPQFAQCGRVHGELDPGTITGRADFGRQGRARILGQTLGALHVHASASGQLIGAEMVCAGAEHLAHELAWLIQRDTHVLDALQLPFYHPVLEEGLRTALQDVRRQLPATGGARRPIPGDAGPGA